MNEDTGAVASQQTQLTPSPAPKPDLSAYLTEQLLELIRIQDLKPGDRLPSAKVLAEHFSVATPTLREALRRLQATGVIDIRHGSGVYVRQVHQRLMLPNPSYGNLDGQAILHLLEARLLIEPHLAELAANHARVEDIASLETCLADAEQYLINQDEPLHRLNMGFHAGIARASGNVVLAHVIESLIDIYSSEQLAIISLFNARARDHQDHLTILAAIQARDADKARERMRRHLEDVRTVVEESLTRGAPSSALAPPASATDST